MGGMAGSTGQPTDSERRAHQLGYHKVLVVDDEVGIRKGCQRVMRAEGHEVLLAETSEQGLELLAENPDTDLALVDLKMPGIGGLEFLSRAAELAPETVRVVMTAYATIETAIEATKLGAYDFLAKPFTPDELIRVVNKALERAHLIRERNRLRARRAAHVELARAEPSAHRDQLMQTPLGLHYEGSWCFNNPRALRPCPCTGTRCEKLGEVIDPAELFEMIGDASRATCGCPRDSALPPNSSTVLAPVEPGWDEPRTVLGTVTVLRDITSKRVEQVKAEFVNMVAHELRAPLAAVSGYLSVILQGMVPDAAKQTEMLQRSDQRLRALLDLVSDLLDVSRMEAGSVRREIAAQDVPGVLHEVVDLLRPLADERHVTLEVDADRPLPKVEADREELIRLFNNLLSNAIKYNREGGSVTATATEDGPYLKISVADTGVGISAEGVKRLFTEFFREKRPETAYVTGTGLGLSIVRRIVDFYHGRVDVQSEEGVGSTFTVWLPYRFDPKAEPTPAQEPTPAAQSQ